MENLIEKLAQSQLTWSVAIVIIAIVMRPVLLAALEIIKENVKSRRDTERDRVEAEKEQTRVLGALKDELVTTRSIYNQMITGVNLIPATLDAMREQATVQHDKAARQYDAMHADLRTIPAEVWRMGDPKLTDIKQAVERYINALQANIESKLDPNAANAREAIRQEFAAITARLTDIEAAMRALNAVRQPSDGKEP